jgi:two-component system, OmpR family, response regulator
MFNKVVKPPKLIFIVEDNAVYAKSLEIYLRTKFEGIDVKIFPVGELAVDNLHLKPEFIVMDYFLNSKFYDAEDGVSIIKVIRDKDPNVQIIVLSSEEDEKTIQKIHDAGCLYLHKNAEAYEKVRNLISLQLIQMNRE